MRVHGELRPPSCDITMPKMSSMTVSVACDRESNSEKNRMAPGDRAGVGDAATSRPVCLGIQAS